VNSLNTILAIAIMFICCNGKILIFTEINNSKRGYPTFWTAPFSILSKKYPYFVCENKRTLYLCIRFKIVMNTIL
ncbi:hypothetical protein OXV64_13090, partial [Bacteroides fragilis]|uniref:hypothetical protein n=1 Tax=Bacteroides hominis TaxID=2763023 RepID=UPI0022A3E4BA|nr:hypothetical protein [Bacteroides fragilis]